MGRSYVQGEHRGHPGLTALIVLVAAVLVAVFFASNNLFVVRTLRVEGVASVSVEDVIRQSGLRQGECVFWIDQEQVRENINAHTMLYFESLDIKFPSTVVLHVRERKATAQIEYLGFMYAVDETGRVLYKSADLKRETDLPVIEGVSIVSIAEGSEPRVNDPTQLSDAKAVMQALDGANMLLLTHELNVSDLENLYIMTRDGTKVELGNAQELPVKLAIAQAILRDQADKKLLGAKIDVSSGQDGYFIPSDL